MLHMVQWLDAQGGWGGGDRRGDGFRGRLGDDQFLHITQLDLPAGSMFYSYLYKRFSDLKVGIREFSFREPTEK